MSVSSRSDGEVSPNARYDFDRLEKSVEFLIEEHERLSGEREALLSELIEREHRIATLESRLEEERSKRATAVEGVDKILGRLDQLQASVASAAEASS
jgi:chromosome segregation ATPase